MTKDKSLPQNIEAERLVIGSILFDPDCLYQIISHLKAEHFYDAKNKNIYTAIFSLFEKRSAIDIPLVNEELKHIGISSKGYKTAMLDMFAEVATSSNVEEYSKLIEESYLRRKLITAGANIIEIAYNEKKEVEDVLSESEKQVFDVSTNKRSTDFVHVQDLAMQYYDNIEELSKHKGEYSGIKTGFKTMDSMLGGFQNSDLVVLGARPSVGKTALSLDIARHIAVHEKKSVAFFSLEMGADQLLQRMVSMETKVGLYELRTNKITPRDVDKVADAIGKISECELYIDDTAGINVLEIRTKARRLKLEKGLDIIFIDYLQLVSGMSKENRAQEVSEVSRQLKILAKELKIPVIALSQLNRQSANSTDHRPQLSQLRESGAIEQDADIVMFLHREEMYNPTDETLKGKAELILAKHRNGPTGIINLQFVPESARYRDVG